jgi:hypothetical protein
MKSSVFCIQLIPLLSKLHSQSTLNCFCSSGNNDDGVADHTITHKAAINSSTPQPLLTLELLPGMPADRAKHPNPSGSNQYVRDGGGSGEMVVM